MLTAFMIWRSSDCHTSRGIYIDYSRYTFVTFECYDDLFVCKKLPLCRIQNATWKPLQFVTILPTTFSNSLQICNNQKPRKGSWLSYNSVNMTSSIYSQTYGFHELKSPHKEALGSANVVPLFLSREYEIRPSLLKDLLLN